MDEYLKKKPWKVVKYEYLKAKTREEDLVKVKGQIEDILKAFGADNTSVNIQKRLQYNSLYRHWQLNEEWE